MDKTIDSTEAATRTDKPRWSSEPIDVRWMRACLRHWPFAHGTGIFLKLFKPLIHNRDFMFAVDPGIVVPARMDDYMIQWCFECYHERDAAFRLSRQLIRPGDTVFDVGANTGLWVMGAARRAGAQGSVHAFEPVPANFNRLHENLVRNGLQRVVCERLALSDASGSATFYMATNGNSGAGALAQREGIDEAIDVTLETLDSYCEQHSIPRIDFMKVDVEGAEMLVFRGGSQILSSPQAPMIMFEVSETLVTSFGSTPSDIKRLLHQYGYSFFHHNGKGLEPVPVDVHHTHEDLFALKPHHLERSSVKNILHKS